MEPEIIKETKTFSKSDFRLIPGKVLAFIYGDLSAAAKALFDADSIPDGLADMALPDEVRKTLKLLSSSIAASDEVEPSIIHPCIPVLLSQYWEEISHLWEDISELFIKAHPSASALMTQLRDDIVAEYDVPDTITVSVSYEVEPVVRGSKGDIGKTAVLQLRNTGRSLCGGIEGEYFGDFLKICFSHSTYFSLSKWRDIDSEPEEIEKLLSGYAVKRFKPATWFGYPFGCSGDTVETVYEANDETLRILLSCYDNIFLRQENESAVEDLCFWQDNTMILGTLSHELICSTNVIGKGFAAELFEVGDWQVLDEPQCGIEGAKWC